MCQPWEISNRMQCVSCFLTISKFNTFIKTLLIMFSLFQSLKFLKNIKSEYPWLHFKSMETKTKPNPLLLQYLATLQFLSYGAGDMKMKNT